MNPAPLMWQYVVHVIFDISSLSSAEFIKLVATWHDFRLGTSKNDSDLESRGYSKEVLEQAKKQKTEKFSGVKSLGLNFTKPLSEFKSDILRPALTYFENYERGVLPFPGSTSEQPAQIMEIFNILYALKYELQEFERKKLEKNGRHANQNKSRTRG